MNLSIHTRPKSEVELLIEPIGDFAVRLLPLAFQYRMNWMHYLENLPSVMLRRVAAKKRTVIREYIRKREEEDTRLYH